MIEASEAEIALLNSIREVVAPLRSYGFEVLAALYSAESVGNDALRRVPEIERHVEKAVAALETRLDDFCNLLSESPDDLEDSQRKLYKTAVKLQKFCNKIARDGSEGFDIDAFDRFLRDKLSPQATRFTDGLSALSMRVSSARMNDQRERAFSMLQQINRLGAQINLIAVNATIEAAHAGEAGRGFAIIASEIQSLSRKSREAMETLQAQL